MIKVPSFGRVGWLSTISATVGIVGDGIAQEFERSKKRGNIQTDKSWLTSYANDWDGARALRVAAYRASTAPVIDIVWKMFDSAASRLRLTPIPAVAFKVAMDQTFLMPTFTCVFFISQSLMEGQSWSAALDRTREGFIPLAIACFQFYSIGHIITFGVIPLRFRVPWNSVLASSWTAYMSYSNQDLRRRETERK